jgi:Sigma-70, region 4
LASTTVRQSTELCKAASVDGLVRRQHGYYDTSDHHHRPADSFRWRLVRPGTLVLVRSKSIKEVAEIIGIAEATVKTRMFYARKKLAALVATA